MAVMLNLSEEELQLFLEETEEQVQTLEDGFLRLEKEGADGETLAALFRAAHTVKGSSAAIGHQQMAELTHAMENILDKMRKGELPPSRPAMDALFKGLDVLRILKNALGSGDEVDADLSGVLNDLKLAVSGPEPTANATAAGSNGTAGPVLPAEVLEKLRKGMAAGLAPLRMEVSLAPDSPMPAVRAYQLYLSLCDQSEVVFSRPTLAEIEGENVGTEMIFHLLTKLPREVLNSVATAVSDVARVDISPIDVEKLTDATAAVNGGTPSAPASPAGPAQTAAAPAHASDAPAHTAAASGAGASAAAVPENRTVRVDVTVLDSLMNLVGELVIDRTRLSQLSGQLSSSDGVEELATEVGRISNHLGRITGFLQDEILKARMLPIDRLFKKFPRMVRDLAQKIGKEIDFIVQGENTELDRSVIEVIGDPLIHLLRNSVDHGLEMPDEREKAGKPRVGTLILSAYHRENQIVVEVSDNGRGIDPVKVRESAVRKGVITAERAKELTDREAQMLIFAPGFSTAKKVSDISGRGVGLDVVQKNIDRLNGRVEVESEVGKGTVFRIYLPLTLATIRALLVRVADQTFALPLSAIVETLRIEPRQIQTIKRQEVVVVREKVVPIRRLERFVRTGHHRVRGGEAAAGKVKNLYAVLVMANGKEIGLVVDSLVGEQEIVLKSLGQFIGDVRGLAGATVLGDGSLALILDVRGLQEAVWEAPAPVRSA